MTAKARAQIRNYLKHQRREASLALGKRLLAHALGDIKLDEVPEALLLTVSEEHKCDSLESLLTEIGLGNVMSIAIARRIKDEMGTDEESDNDKSSGQVSIKGTEGMLVSFGKCCRPIPGDEIIAHVSPGKGLTIHREPCRNIKGYSKDPGHYFPVEWDSEPGKEFIAEIRVEIINHQGALAKLTNVISSTEANVQQLNTEEKTSNLYNIDVQLTVRDRVHLAHLMRRIRVMPDVQKVARQRK